MAKPWIPTKVKNADDDLEASGLGYIQFAMKWPEHFRVMWHSELLDQQSHRLRLARERAEGFCAMHWSMRTSRRTLRGAASMARPRSGLKGLESHGHSTKHDGCFACCGYHLCETRALFLKKPKGADVIFRGVWTCLTQNSFTGRVVARLWSGELLIVEEGSL